MMKKWTMRVVTLLLAVVLLLVVLPDSAEAVFFTSVNDEDIRISSAPVFSGGSVYMPYSFFVNNNLGIYYTSVNENMYCLYSSGVQLFFSRSDGMVTDQNGNEYPGMMLTGGSSDYVSVMGICYYFGLLYSYIPTELGNIIRINANVPSMTDSLFVTMNYSTMNRLLREGGYVVDPTASPSASPSPSVTPENHSTETVSFAFVGLEAASQILDRLNRYGYTATFFVSETEILNNADILRRISGQGNALGLVLQEGTAAEYARVSALLFEACKVRTGIVTAEKGAAELEAELGLTVYSLEVFTGTAEELQGMLPQQVFSRKLFVLDCTGETNDLLSGILPQVRSSSYGVRALRETDAVSSWQ